LLGLHFVQESIENIGKNLGMDHALTADDTIAAQNDDNDIESLHGNGRMEDKLVTNISENTPSNFDILATFHA
jgi:hypothetical protein